MTVPTLAPADPRSGAWQVDPGFGVYVHIPFCRHRCHYCDFNTYEGHTEVYEAYVDALVADIGRWEGEVRPATSIFFGGGTPTLLDPASLGRILRAVIDRAGVADDVEITIEANPETVDEPYLRKLRAAGFARISIGVQSLVPKVLAGLGRTHSPERALQAIAAARAAGFDDINADLIYGSPWETDDDWMRSLEGIVAAGVDHVSAYALTIEAGTPLATLIETGRSADVDPDVQAHRHAVADRVLGTAGFKRYEISNWSRPGRASRHNVLYWSAGDYLGFGCGAHAHVAGERWWVTRLPRDFIGAVAAGSITVAGSELLAADERAGEALMLGLRLVSGIEVAGFAERYGREALSKRAVVVAELRAQGLLDPEPDRLRLSPRGTLIANEALMRLL